MLTFIINCSQKISLSFFSFQTDSTYTEWEESILNHPLDEDGNLLPDFVEDDRDQEPADFDYAYPVRKK